ncbi:MAG: hypothetical protein HY698_02955 [Deltaproteobacteria bacterium]|nr:hypothetical protein [Deltaproteobacteria bacterium]
MSRRGRIWTYLTTGFSTTAFTVGAGMAGCGGEEPQGPGALGSETGSIVAGPVLNTFITYSLQVDQLGSPTATGDSNLFLTSDPADGSPSVALPSGGPSDFLDWHELILDSATGIPDPERLANHRLADVHASKDKTAFPRSNECVGESSVLSKMDITYVASANNSKHAYFAVQRSANNGDAAYYWILTRREPRLAPGGPCNLGEQRLMYDLSGPDSTTGATGDVLLVGHFHPNDTPLLRVYRAVADRAGLTAIQAIDFANTALWAPDPAAVAASAVNTTVTDPGALGAAGVVGLTTRGYLKPELFAEAAVPLSVFGGGSSLCGSTYYGSVITRSSGAGGTSPDLKDLAGPALFNFGTVSANASLTPTCGLDVAYRIDVATGANGQSMEAPGCLWQFDDGSTSTSCSGIHAMSPGSHVASVTVTDPGFGCSVTVDVDGVEVYPPLSASATLGLACAGQFTYDAEATGGASGPVSFSWAFSGDSVPDPSSSTQKSGLVSVPQLGFPYSATIEVTQDRPDGLHCSASASATITPRDPVTIAVLTPTCGLGVEYQVKSSTGTDGEPLSTMRCSWAFDDGTTSTSCSGITELPVGARTGNVTVTDPISGCTDTATQAVAVVPPLQVTANLVENCQMQFGYQATVTGGSGDALFYDWAFAGGPTDATTSSASEGTVTVYRAGIPYQGTVRVTQLRTDGLACSAAATDTATPLAPLAASLRLVGTPQACPSMTSDQVTYEATATGGSGNYVYTWNGETTCGGTTCTVDPPADAFCAEKWLSVTVTDPTGFCQGVTSETESYSKITLVTASDR